MSLENRPRNKGFQQELDDISIKKGVLLRNEISLEHSFGIIERYFDNFKNKTRDLYPATIYDVKAFIKKEVGPKDPVVRGPAEIAKGEKMSLVITPDQVHAFVFVYNLNLASDVPFFASVESADEKPKRVKAVSIKYIDIVPKSPNNIIISKGLAEKLEVKKGDHIKVTSIYQRTSNINLDNY